VLRSRVLSPSAFEALREAAVPIGAVCWVPPGHPVRDRPDVIAGTLPVESSNAPGPPRSGPLLFAPLIGLDGEPLGLLNPADPLHGSFPGPRQTLLLETLAELTVVGLEIVRARAVERAAVAVAEAQRRQLEDLLSASAQIRGYYSLDEVLREIARAMTTAGASVAPPSICGCPTMLSWSARPWGSPRPRANSCGRPGNARGIR